MARAATGAATTGAGDGDKEQGVGENEELNEQKIINRASNEFGGVQQLVGNGGFGDKMIGVDGEDTIDADGWPEFKECELEEEE